MARSRVCYLLCASLVAIESSAADGPPPDVKPGAFSRSYLNPWELQFGCVGTHDDEEERYAKQLAAAEADPSDRLKAAKTLSAAPVHGLVRRFQPPPGCRAERQHHSMFVFCSGDNLSVNRWM